jgi:Uma2 family endonuclease
LDAHSNFASQTLLTGLAKLAWKEKIMVADPLRLIPSEELLRREQEYLEQEKEAETKSEFLGGEIIAMAGASPTHVRINVSVTGILRNQLRGQLCEPFAQDSRLKVAGLSPLLTNDYTYPDVIVACDAQFDADNHLLNPVVIIEVLSPSTELKDRTQKLDAYRHIPTLRDYLLVAQERMRVEHYHKLDDSEWRWRIYEATDETIALDAIGCALNLGEIYERVNFDAPAPESESS